MLCIIDDFYWCLYKYDDVIFVSKEDFRIFFWYKEEVYSYCKL